MSTPDLTPAGGPPSPERDHYTIDSIKRTVCAALLIWVSRSREGHQSTGHGRAAKITAGGGVLVAVLLALAGGVGIELPIK